jgi:hypothetical protein
MTFQLDLVLQPRLTLSKKSTLVCGCHVRIRFVIQSAVNYQQHWHQAHTLQVHGRCAYYLSERAHDPSPGLGTIYNPPEPKKNVVVEPCNRGQLAPGLHGETELLCWAMVS